MCCNFALGPLTGHYCSPVLAKLLLLHACNQALLCTSCHRPPLRAARHGSQALGHNPLIPAQLQSNQIVVLICMLLSRPWECLLGSQQPCC